MLVTEAPLRKNWLVQLMRQWDSSGQIHRIERIENIRVLDTFSSQNNYCLIDGESFPFFQQTLEDAFQYFPKVRICVIDERPHLMNALLVVKNNLYNYLSKTDRIDSFEHQFYQFLAGRRTYSQASASWFFYDAVNDQLKVFRNSFAETLSQITPRELDFWLRFLQGEDTTSISQRMKLTKKSTYNLKSQLMKRLEIHRESELIFKGLELGLYRFKSTLDF